jgi:hypothetical protein
MSVSARRLSRPSTRHRPQRAATATKYGEKARLEVLDQSAERGGALDKLPLRFGEILLTGCDHQGRQA